VTSAEGEDEDDERHATRSWFRIIGRNEYCPTACFDSLGCLLRLGGGRSSSQVPGDWFFLGVGVLILIAQLARWRLNLGIEWFWIACGAVFLAGGLWTLLNLPWPLAPMLLILLGVALFAKTVVGIVR
jgi:hypothetical protein